MNSLSSFLYSLKPINFFELTMDTEVSETFIQSLNAGCVVFFKSLIIIIVVCYKKTLLRFTHNTRYQCRSSD